MGMDKEAADIWLFGRPRPDLSAQETFAESGRRQNAVSDHLARRALGPHTKAIIDLARKSAESA